MKINLQYFGMVAEITKLNNEFFKIDSDVVAKSELIGLLQDKYPELCNITYNLAYNCNIVTEEINFKDNDQIALLPPFAGG